MTCDCALQMGGRYRKSKLTRKKSKRSKSAGSVYSVAQTDNTYDLGNSSFRWDDVRATNGTIQTSDRNLKTQISGSDLGLDFINDLNPVKYQWLSSTSLLFLHQYRYVSLF